MKIKFPHNLSSFMSENGRHFIASHHDNGIIDLDIYGIYENSEFLKSGFTAIDEPKQADKIVLTKKDK